MRISVKVNVNVNVNVNKGNIVTQAACLSNPQDKSMLAEA